MKKISSLLVLMWLMVSPLAFAQTSIATEESTPSDAEIYEYVKSYYADAEINEEITPEELDALIQDEISAYKQTGISLEEYFYPSDEELGGFTGDSDYTPFGNTACFDHYVFGSVEAVIDTEVDTVVPGIEMVFTGVIENNNPYPLTEGSLYVKLFREPDPKMNHDITENGPDVVDQFVAVKDISIPASGSVPVEFTWQVPTSVVSGQYELATFFTTSDRYNLLGLSFTDDVVGNTVPFSVVSDNESRVYFDKNLVTVNDEPYFFAAYPPRTSKDDSVTVSATLINDTNETIEVPVTYTLYEWDALRQENRISTQHETVTLPANQSVAVSHNSPVADYPVYLLEMRADWMGSKSLLNVRYVRMDVDKPRINFPSLTTFPIKAGQETSMFSCLHNVGEALVPVTLKLTLSDKDGKVVSVFEESGDLPPDMSAVISEFTTERGYDFLVLDAELYHEGELVESERVVYDCNNFGDNDCLPATDKEVQILEKSNKLEVFWLIAGVMVVIGVGFMALRLIRKKTNSDKEDYTTPTY